MKMINKSTLVLAILGIVLFASSCKDKFTEEDLLNAQQTIDYSVVFKDAATLLGIEGATVTIVQNGVELTATTNAQGVATFIKISIGNGFPITITATDYLTISSNVYFYTDYREAEHTDFYYTLSQTANLATVKGVVEIETDVTNLIREKVDGTEVRAVFISGSSYSGVDLNDLHFTITATTAADGTYTLALPTFGDGVDYSIFVNDIEVGQTIAYNNEVGQPLFPATLPQVASVLTAFSGASSSPVGFPIGVPSVFATIGASPTGVGATVAELNIAGFQINALGAITGIQIPVSGLGYAASSTTLATTITSLAGGSGAIITANTDALGQVTGFNITNGGSGYPTGNPNPNVASPSAPQNVSFSIQVRPGDIRIINIYYGTGTSRALEIE